MPTTFSGALRTDSTIGGIVAFHTLVLRLGASGILTASGVSTCATAGWSSIRTSPWAGYSTSSSPGPSFLSPVPSAVITFFSSSSNSLSIFTTNSLLASRTTSSPKLFTASSLANSSESAFSYAPTTLFHVVRKTQGRRVDVALERACREGNCPA